jgi:hypothetical protein
MAIPAFLIGAIATATGNGKKSYSNYKNLRCMGQP